MAAIVLESGIRAGLTDTDWRSTGATTTLPAQATLTGAAGPPRVMRFPFPGGEIVVKTPGDPPAWLEPTAHALCSLLKLEAGWDSYDGQPINPNCVKASLELASTVLRDDSPNPSVVPTSRGGIQFEWHTGGVDLEVEFISPSLLIGFFEDQRTGTKWEKDLTFDLRPLVEAVATLSQHLRSLLRKRRMADEFDDDLTIGDQAGLWRRIHPKWVVRDATVRGWRVSSAAFDNSPDRSPTSVLLADLVAETGRTANDVLEGYEEHALAQITAGRARKCEQGVARDPRPEEPAHGYVFGRKTKPNKRCLAQGAEWIIPRDPE